jgi:hypothetical protein
MTKKTAVTTISDAVIMSKMYFIRGEKVLLDRDLAALYGVQTKVLKQSVKRHINRFPEDFMFEMTKQELEIWRSQHATSQADKMGLRHSPFCFTQQGVAMLASVLNSEIAINVNIQIVRVFAKVGQMLMDNTELRLAIEKLERKTDNHTKNIELVFHYLSELQEKKDKNKPRKQIGYKLPKKK